jgi:hypothetical protein
MTRVGRIMLFVNLALSLVFAVWALGLYSNRIDRMAELKARTTDLETAKKNLATAEARWRAADEALHLAEKRRPELQRWYETELAILQQGNKRIQAVALVGGKVRVKPDGKVELGLVLDTGGRDVQGLKSLEGLNKDYTQVQDELRTSLLNTNMAFNDEQKLTAIIGNGQKGLRKDLADQQRAERNSLDEQEFLKPLLYNRLAEVQSLTQRHSALESRLKELKAVALAHQP